MTDRDVAHAESDGLATAVLASPPLVAVPAMLDLFGKPPVLRSEDANHYDALLSRLVVAARPRDPFEWILLKDYADLAWDVFRLRRARTGIIDGARKDALVIILDRLRLDVRTARNFYNDPDTRALILQQLADRGLDEEIIIHEAVSHCSGRLAALDRLIASAEHRRNAMLREMDYHRGNLATRLRTAPDVVDAEIEDAPHVGAGTEPQPA